MSNTPGTPDLPPLGPNGEAPENPGPGVITGLDTPADLDAEWRKAFDEIQARNASVLGFTPPSTDAAAAAAMAAATGNAVLPQPTVGSDGKLLPPPASQPTSQPAPDTGTGTATETPPPAPSAVGPSTATVDGAASAAPPTTPSPAGGAALPPPEPASDGGYDLTFFNHASGQIETRHLSPQDIADAVGLRAWADNLPQQTRAAIEALDNGQGRIVAAADYDRYLAWQASQQTPSAPGVPGVPGVPVTPSIDLSDLDPQTAQAIQQQQAALAAAQQQLAVQQQYIEQQVRAQAGAEFDAQTRAQTAAMDAASQEYARQRGLTGDELNLLVDTAIQAGIVPYFVNQHTTVNPVTGKPYGPPDPYKVVWDSLDFAIQRQPAVYQAALAREHAARTTPGSPTNPTANPTVPTMGTPPTASVPTVGGLPVVPQAPDITAKRAAAASMATAPSAAVQLPQMDPRQMTREQTVNAIAATIEAYQQGR